MSKWQGCFEPQTCEDVSRFPDDPGRSAAWCDTGQFVDLCMCCRSYEPRPSVCPSDCAGPPVVPPLPPDNPPKPPVAPPTEPPVEPPSAPSPAPSAPSPSPTPGTIAKPAPDGCKAINERRSVAMSCDDGRTTDAVEMLDRVGSSCKADDLLAHFTPREQSTMALELSDKSRPWKDTVNDWFTKKGGHSWAGWADPLFPRIQLGSLGAMTGGCAEVVQDGCHVRLCVVDPFASTDMVALR